MSSGNQIGRVATTVVAAGFAVLAGCHTPRPEIETAIHNGSESQINDQLAHGAKLEEADGHGMTPLNYAVWDKHPGTAKLLLDRGANPNTHDERGNTPLYYAVRHNSDEMVSALLAHGADPMAKCEKDVTPIDLASDRGYTSIVAEMKEHAAH